VLHGPAKQDAGSCAESQPFDMPFSVRSGLKVTLNSYQFRAVTVVVDVVDALGTRLPRALLGTVPWSAQQR
jgi:hypothetical protein